jgi:hypothetical protein
MANEYVKTLTSFSGADLVVAFGKRVIGELQSISWAIQRKKAPIYTLGSSDPRSFSRGVRGIAGSLVFAVFDRDALIEELKQVWEDIAPAAMFTAAGNLLKRGKEDFMSALSLTNWNAVTSGGTDINGYSVSEVGEVQPKQTGSDDKTLVDVPPGFSVIRKDNIMYADMLPPFDITMTFANEYGQTAFQKIYDVDILNEGSGVSVDSIVMERQMTFIARRISPLIQGVYNREAAKTTK